MLKLYWCLRKVASEVSFATFHQPSVHDFTVHTSRSVNNSSILTLKYKVVLRKTREEEVPSIYYPA